MQVDWGTQKGQWGGFGNQTNCYAAPSKASDVKEQTLDLTLGLERWDFSMGLSCVLFSYNATAALSYLWRTSEHPKSLWPIQGLEGFSASTTLSSCPAALAWAASCCLLQPGRGICQTKNNLLLFLVVGQSVCEELVQWTCSTFRIFNSY